MNIKPEKNTVEIDLSINGTYVVSNGEVTPLQMPPSGYGRHEIQWLGGKMTVASNTETVKPCNNAKE